MATRLPNYRLVKIHRAYTIAEVARLLGVHRNTVRRWIREGLATNDSKRPALVLGRDLSDFLRSRRLNNKRPCGPGEIYCVRCREPRRPAGKMADFRPGSNGTGNLVGICPTCDLVIFRRVTIAKLEEDRGDLEVAIREAEPRIGERLSPSVNGDFRVEA